MIPCLLGVLQTEETSKGTKKASAEVGQLLWEFKINTHLIFKNEFNSVLLSV